MSNKGKQRYKQRVIRGLMLCTLILSQSAQTYMGVVQATTQVPQIELNQAALNQTALEAEIAKKKEEDEKQKEQEDLADSGLEQEPESGDDPPEKQGFEPPAMKSALFSPIAPMSIQLRTNLGFLAGDGSEEAPFTFTNTREDLEKIRQAESLPIKTGAYNYSTDTEFQPQGGFYYRFNSTGTSVIDLTGTDWEPIENFRGHIDGNNLSISGENLTISNLTAAEGGLFASIDGGTIKNLNITNAKVSTTSSQNGLGILANSAKDATITNVTVQGEVAGAVNAENIGGLIGSTEGGDIRNCIVKEETTVEGRAFLGGFVGFTNNTLLYGNTSHADVRTIATGMVGTSIGGFIGQASGQVGAIGEAKNSATGNVTGHTSVGGFVGTARGPIVNAESSGDVTGIYLVGGLIGFADSVAASVNKTKATGSVTATGGSVGGLIGRTLGSVTDSAATGIVILWEEDGMVDLITVPSAASRGQSAGGLIGHTSQTVTDSFATGAVLALPTTGKAEAVFEGSEQNKLAQLADFINDIKRDDIWVDSSFVGGLVGRAETTAAVISGDYEGGDYSTTYATGIVVGGAYVGGLVGQTNARVSNASAGAFAAKGTGFALGTSTVIGTGGYIGGLIGQTTVGGTLTNPAVTWCYSVGDTYGAFDGEGNLIKSASASASNVGGLIGNVTGATTTNWQQGSVYGNQNVGGLIGYVNAAVADSYATGGTIFGDYYVGGLVGNGDTSTAITNCYTSNQVRIKDKRALGNGVSVKIQGNEYRYAGGIYGGINGTVKGCVAIGGISSEGVGATDVAAIAPLGNGLPSSPLSANLRWNGFTINGKADNVGHGADGDKPNGGTTTAAVLQELGRYTAGQANNNSGALNSNYPGFKFVSGYGTSPLGPWIWGADRTGNESVNFPVLGFGPQRPNIPFLYYLWAADTVAVYGTDGFMKELQTDGSLANSEKKAEWDVYANGRTLTVPVSALFTPDSDSDSDYNNYTYRLVRVDFTGTADQQAFNALGLNLNAQTFTYETNGNLKIVDNPTDGTFAAGEGLFSYEQIGWKAAGDNEEDLLGNNLITFTFPEEMDTVVGTYTIQARHNPTQGVQYSQMSFMITPKEIHVTGGEVNHKVFDGTKTATWASEPDKTDLAYGFGADELVGDGTSEPEYDDEIFGETIDWGVPEFADEKVGTDKTIRLSVDSPLTGKNHKNYVPTLGDIKADILPLDVSQIGIEYVPGTTVERVYDGTDKAVIKTAPKVRLIYNPELMAEYNRRLKAEADWEDENPGEPYEGALASAMTYTGFFDIELGEAGDTVTYDGKDAATDDKTADKTVINLELDGELVDHLSDELKAVLGEGDELDTLTALLEDYLDGEITAQKVTEDGYPIFEITVDATEIEVYKKGGKLYKLGMPATEANEVEDNTTRVAVPEDELTPLFALGLITRKPLTWAAPTAVDKAYDGTPFIAAMRTDGSEVKFPEDVLPTLTGLVAGETVEYKYDHDWAKLDLGDLSDYLTHEGNLSQGGATESEVRVQTENWLKTKGAEWWKGTELTDLGKYFVNNIGNVVDGQVVIDHIALLTAKGEVYVSSDIRHETKEVSEVKDLHYTQSMLTYEFVSGKPENYKFVTMPKVGETPETAVDIMHADVKNASPIPQGSIIPQELRKEQIRLIPGQVDDKEYDGTATATLSKINQRSNNAQVTRAPHIHMVLFPSIEALGGAAKYGGEIVTFGGRDWEILDPASTTYPLNKTLDDIENLEKTNTVTGTTSANFAYREISKDGLPYTFIHYADIDVEGLEFDGVNVGEVYLANYTMNLPTAIIRPFSIYIGTETEEARKNADNDNWVLVDASEDNPRYEMLYKNLFGQASNPDYFTDFLDETNGLSRLINRTCAQYYLKEEYYTLGDDGFKWNRNDYLHQISTDSTHYTDKEGDVAEDGGEIPALGGSHEPNVHNPNQDKIPEITPRRLVWTAGQVASKEYDSTKNVYEITQEPQLARPAGLTGDTLITADGVTEVRGWAEFTDENVGTDVSVQAAMHFDSKNSRSTFWGLNGGEYDNEDTGITYAGASNYVIEEKPSTLDFEFKLPSFDGLFTMEGITYVNSKAIYPDVEGIERENPDYIVTVDGVKQLRFWQPEFRPAEITQWLIDNVDEVQDLNRGFATKTWDGVDTVKPEHIIAGTEDEALGTINLSKTIQYPTISRYEFEKEKAFGIWNAEEANSEKEISDFEAFQKTTEYSSWFDDAYKAYWTDEDNKRLKEETIEFTSAGLNLLASELYFEDELVAGNIPSSSTARETAFDGNYLEMMNYPDPDGDFFNKQVRIPVLNFTDENVGFTGAAATHLRNYLYVGRIEPLEITTENWVELLNYFVGDISKTYDGTDDYRDGVDEHNLAYLYVQTPEQSLRGLSSWAYHGWDGSPEMNYATERPHTGELVQHNDLWIIDDTAAFDADGEEQENFIISDEVYYLLTLGRDGFNDYFGGEEGKANFENDLIIAIDNDGDPLTVSMARAYFGSREYYLNAIPDGQAFDESLYSMFDELQEANGYRDYFEDVVADSFADWKVENPYVPADEAAFVEYLDKNEKWLENQFISAYAFQLKQDQVGGVLSQTDYERWKDGGSAFDDWLKNTATSQQQEDFSETFADWFAREFETWSEALDFEEKPFGEIEEDLYQAWLEKEEERWDESGYATYLDEEFGKWDVPVNLTDTPEYEDWRKTAFDKWKKDSTEYQELLEENYEHWIIKQFFETELTASVEEGPNTYTPEEVFYTGYGDFEDGSANYLAWKFVNEEDTTDGYTEAYYAAVELWLEEEGDYGFTAFAHDYFHAWAGRPEDANDPEFAQVIIDEGTIVGAYTYSEWLEREYAKWSDLANLAVAQGWNGLPLYTGTIRPLELDLDDISNLQVKTAAGTIRKVYDGTTDAEGKHIVDGEPLVIIVSNYQKVDKNGVPVGDPEDIEITVPGAEAGADAVYTWTEGTRTFNSKDVGKPGISVEVEIDSENLGKLFTFAETDGDGGSAVQTALETWISENLFEGEIYPLVIQSMSFEDFKANAEEIMDDEYQDEETYEAEPADELSYDEWLKDWFEKHNNFMTTTHPDDPKAEGQTLLQEWNNFDRLQELYSGLIERVYNGNASIGLSGTDNKKNPETSVAVAARDEEKALPTSGDIPENEALQWKFDEIASNFLDGAYNDEEDKTKAKDVRLDSTELPAYKATGGKLVRVGQNEELGDDTAELAALAAAITTLLGDEGQENVILDGSALRWLQDKLFTGQINPKALTWVDGVAQDKDYDGTSEVEKFTHPSLDGDIYNSEIQLWNDLGEGHGLNTKVLDVHFSKDDSPTSAIGGPYTISFNPMEVMFKNEYGDGKPDPTHNPKEATESPEYTAASSTTHPALYNYIITGAQNITPASIIDDELVVDTKADYALAIEPREYDGTLELELDGVLKFDITSKNSKTGDTKLIPVTITQADLIGLRYVNSDVEMNDGKGDKKIIFDSIAHQEEFNHVTEDYEIAALNAIKDLIIAQTRGTVYRRMVSWSIGQGADKEYDGNVLANVEKQPELVRPYLTKALEDMTFKELQALGSYTSALVDHRAFADFESWQEAQNDEALEALFEADETVNSSYEDFETFAENTEEYEAWLEAQWEANPTIIAKAAAKVAKVNPGKPRFGSADVGKADAKFGADSFLTYAGVAEADYYQIVSELWRNYVLVAPDTKLEDFATAKRLTGLVNRQPNVLPGAITVRDLKDKEEDSTISADWFAKLEIMPGVSIKAKDGNTHVFSKTETNLDLVLNLKLDDLDVKDELLALIEKDKAGWKGNKYELSDKVWISREGEAGDYTYHYHLKVDFVPEALPKVWTDAEGWKDQLSFTSDKPKSEEASAYNDDWQMINVFPNLEDKTEWLAAMKALISSNFDFEGTFANDIEDATNAIGETIDNLDEKNFYDWLAVNMYKGEITEVGIVLPPEDPGDEEEGTHYIVVDTIELVQTLKEYDGTFDTTDDTGTFTATIRISDGDDNPEDDETYTAEFSYSELKYTNKNVQAYGDHAMSVKIGDGAKVTKEDGETSKVDDGTVFGIDLTVKNYLADAKNSIFQGEITPRMIEWSVGEPADKVYDGTATARWMTAAEVAEGSVKAQMIADYRENHPQAKAGAKTDAEIWETIDNGDGLTGEPHLIRPFGLEGAVNGKGDTITWTPPAIAFGSQGSEAVADVYYVDGDPADKPVSATSAWVLADLDNYAFVFWNNTTEKYDYMMNGSEYDRTVQPTIDPAKILPFVITEDDITPGVLANWDIAHGHLGKVFDATNVFDYEDHNSKQDAGDKHPAEFTISYGREEAGNPTTTVTHALDFSHFILGNLTTVDASVEREKIVTDSALGYNDGKGNIIIKDKDDDSGGNKVLEWLSDQLFQARITPATIIVPEDVEDIPDQDDMTPYLVKFIPAWYKREYDGTDIYKSSTAPTALLVINNPDFDELSDENETNKRHLVVEEVTIQPDENGKIRFDSENVGAAVELAMADGVEEVIPKLELSGIDLSNYDLSAVNTYLNTPANFNKFYTGAITKRQLTWSVGEPADKRYDGTTAARWMTVDEMAEPLKVDAIAAYKADNPLTELSDEEILEEIKFTYAGGDGAPKLIRPNGYTDEAVISADKEKVTVTAPAIKFGVKDDEAPEAVYYNDDVPADKPVSGEYWSITGAGWDNYEIHVSGESREDDVADIRQPWISDAKILPRQVDPWVPGGEDDKLIWNSALVIGEGHVKKVYDGKLDLDHETGGQHVESDGTLTLVLTEDDVDVPLSALPGANVKVVKDKNENDVTVYELTLTRDADFTLDDMWLRDPNVSTGYDKRVRLEDFALNSNFIVVEEITEALTDLSADADGLRQIGNRLYKAMVTPIVIVPDEPGEGEITVSQLTVHQGQIEKVYDGTTLVDARDHDDEGGHIYEWATISFDADAEDSVEPVEIPFMYDSLFYLTPDVHSDSVIQFKNFILNTSNFIFEGEAELAALMLDEVTNAERIAELEASIGVLKQALMNQLYLGEITKRSFADPDPEADGKITQRILDDMLKIDPATYTKVYNGNTSLATATLVGGQPVLTLELSQLLNESILEQLIAEAIWDADVYEVKGQNWRLIRREKVGESGEYDYSFILNVGSKNYPDKAELAYESATTGEGKHVHVYPDAKDFAQLLSHLDTTNFDFESASFAEELELTDIDSFLAYLESKIYLGNITEGTVELPPTDPSSYVKDKIYLGTVTPIQVSKEYDGTLDVEASDIEEYVDVEIIHTYTTMVETEPDSGEYEESEVQTSTETVRVVISDLAYTDKNVQTYVTKGMAFTVGATAKIVSGDTVTEISVNLDSDTIDYLENHLVEGEITPRLVYWLDVQPADKRYDGTTAATFAPDTETTNKAKLGYIHPATAKDVMSADGVIPIPGKIEFADADVEENKTVNIVAGSGWTSGLTANYRLVEKEPNEGEYVDDTDGPNISLANIWQRQIIVKDDDKPVETKNDDDEIISIMWNEQLELVIGHVEKEYDGTTAIDKAQILSTPVAKLRVTLTPADVDLAEAELPDGFFTEGKHILELTLGTGASEFDFTMFELKNPDWSQFFTKGIEVTGFALGSNYAMLSGLTEPSVDIESDVNKLETVGNALYQGKVNQKLILPDDIHDDEENPMGQLFVVPGTLEKEFDGTQYADERLSSEGGHITKKATIEFDKDLANPANLLEPLTFTTGEMEFEKAEVHTDGSVSMAAFQLDANSNFRFATAEDLVGIEDEILIAKINASIAAYETVNEMLYSGTITPRQITDDIINGTDKFVILDIVKGYVEKVFDNTTGIDNDKHVKSDYHATVTFDMDYFPEGQEPVVWPADDLFNVDDKTFDTKDVVYDSIGEVADKTVTVNDGNLVKSDHFVLDDALTPSVLTALRQMLYAGRINPAQVGTEDEEEDAEKPEITYSANLSQQGRVTKDYDGDRTTTNANITNPKVSVTIGGEVFNLDDLIDYGLLTYDSRHVNGSTDKAVSAERATLAAGNIILTDELMAELMATAYVGTIKPLMIHWSTGTLEAKHYDRVSDATAQIVEAPKLVDSTGAPALKAVDIAGWDDEMNQIYTGLNVKSEGKLTYDSQDVARDSAGNLIAVPVTATGWGVEGEQLLLNNYELTEADIQMTFAMPGFPGITGVAGKSNPNAQPNFKALPVGGTSPTSMFGGIIAPRPVSFDGTIEIAKTYDGNAHLVADDIHGNEGSNWQTLTKQDIHQENFSYAYDSAQGIKKSSVADGILHQDEAKNTHDDILHTIANFVGQQRVDGLIDPQVNLTKAGEFFHNSNYNNSSKLVGEAVGNYELTNTPPIATRIDKTTGPRIEMTATTGATSVTVSSKYFDTHGPAVTLPALTQSQAVAQAEVKTSAVFATSGYASEATSEFTEQHQNFTVYQISATQLTNIQPYSSNPSAWQASPTFTNLTPGQTYYIYAQTTDASRNFQEGPISELKVGAENVNAPSTGKMPSTGEATGWLTQGGILATVIGALLFWKKKKEDKDEDEEID